MSEIVLSPDQKRAHDSVLDWYKSRRTKLLTLAGYAGTGKTTILGVTRRTLNETVQGLRVAYCAYTGKASWVLRRKLNSSGGFFSHLDSCSTIHGLIYRPVVDEKTGDIIDWQKSPFLDRDLIIVDEASMVNEEIFNDLSSYGIPILAVGDHGQLPPIKGSLNLMEFPDLRLEKIHRQAEENPILWVSKVVREDGKFCPFGEYGNYGNGGVLRTPMNPASEKLLDKIFSGFTDDTMLLSGTNRMRVELNSHIRGKLFSDIDSYPTVNDRVICLQNNRKAQKTPIFNGMTGRVVSIREENEYNYFCEIKMDHEKESYTGMVSKMFFNNETGQLPENLKLKHWQMGDRFDFGYCMTVHKAQGSEAKDVVLFDRNKWRNETEDNFVRWLYTAVTRAVDNLLIVS